MDSVHIQKMNIQPVFILLIGVMLAVSGCAATSEYQKLDIDPKSMSESINIGSNIEVETKKLIYRITVTGYEGEELLIGIEESDGREVRIPFDKIIEIGTGAPSHKGEDPEGVMTAIGDVFLNAALYVVLIIGFFALVAL